MQTPPASLSAASLSFIWAIRLFVKQQYICLELYHRYSQLLPADLHMIGCSKIARMAGNLVSALSPLAKDCIDAIGPPYLDMIYRACQYLQECLDKLDDPFERQQATSDSNSYFTLLEQVDALRRVNAVAARPRAYNASTSVIPSRAASPVLQPADNALTPAANTGFDPSALLFQDIWQPSTSFADPSVGSMALVNMLPYYNVPGYQQMLEAYAYSPSDAAGPSGTSGFANG